MEAILGSDSQLFETFLSDHIKNDPEAKLMFKVMKQTDPDCLSLKLINYLCPDSNHHIYFREECAELVRKLITDDDNLCTWHKLSVSAQSSIKCTLLECMKPEEESKFIIRELRKTVSKLAASLLPHNWPELMPFLYQCINTSGSNNYLRESAFWIFGDLVKDTGKAVAPCIKTWHPLFLNTLNDDTLRLGVRMVATTAVINFIQCVPDSNEKERFQDLLPGMLSTVTDPLSNSDAANVVLEHFILLAKNEPRFLRRQLREVVSTMFDIAEADSFQEGMRHSAIEVLITLVEAKERAPGMMKRLPLFVSRFFALLLNLLLDIKDRPTWHDLPQSTEFSSSFLVGLNCLRRFSIALGGKSIAHIAKEQLSPYLASPEWEKRHAALRALGCVAEGWSQPQVEIKNIGQVANVVLNCLKDPHPLVRYTACLTIHQFLIYFAQHVQEKYHNRILLALFATMDDVHPRVQDCAAKALCDFCLRDKSKTLIPHLDEIVKKLLLPLQNDKDIVQHQALSTMAFIALSAEERFLPYYDTVMLHMKNVLGNADLNSNLILRTIALEFMSHGGLFVGKEKFRDDAKQVMELLMSLQGLQAMADDPTTSFLLRACMRVCVCIGKDFLPYMNTVMPILIQCAQLEPVSTDCAKPKLNNKVYGIDFICIEDLNNPNVLEAKCRACYSLYFIADALKEDFYPWIPQAVSTFVPLMTRYTSKDIREFSVQAMPVLLRSAELAVEKGIAQGESESYFKELSDYIITSLVEALHKDHLEEICALMLKGLNNCLQICRPLLNEGHLRRLVDTVKHVITESSNRKRKLKERAKFKDYDAEEDELLWKERKREDEIVFFVGHLLVTLIKTFKAAFLPLFDELSPYLIPMWGKDMTAREKATSSFIFNGILIQCPEAALKYFDVFVPLLLDASNDETPVVRQNAFYGLRLCVEYGGSIFKPFVGEALSRINVVITHIRAREPENEFAYENAVFLLGKICQVHRESIDSVQIIPAWLSCLPIKRNLLGAKVLHNQLFSMVERSDRDLLGPNYLHLPKVISVFAEVLCARGDLATEDTVEHMINF